MNWDIFKLYDEKQIELYKTCNIDFITRQPLDPNSPTPNFIEIGKSFGMTYFNTRRILENVQLRVNEFNKILSERCLKYPYLLPDTIYSHFFRYNLTTIDDIIEYINNKRGSFISVKDRIECAMLPIRGIGASKIKIIIEALHKIEAIDDIVMT
jgi:hypothetical protein